MLAPVLEEVDHLVLAGDVWQECQSGSTGEVARQKYEALLRMIRERGLSVEVLRGNHDPGESKGVAWLANGAVLATHGDAVYDDATPWSRGFPAHRREVDAIVARYAPRDRSAEACAERAREIALALKTYALPRLPPPLNFFATALWPPGRAFEIVRVWRKMGEEGLRFLKRAGDGAGVLVCGHFHRAGIWQKEGALMINTGSFMKGSRAWAVDVKGDRLTARVLELRDDRYFPGEVKGRWLLGELGKERRRSEETDGRRE